MQANQIISSLNSDEKTIIIAPYKYRQYIMEEVKDIALNVNVSTASILVEEVLANQNIEFDKESSIVKKILINDKLQNHEYHNNINFIDQLLKLEKEFQNSNIVSECEYSEFLDLQSYDFSNIHYDCDRLIVFEEDLQPIHNQVIEQLKNQGVKVDYVENKNETSQYFEYNNTVEMLNGIFDSLINETQQTLVICDNQINRDYLKNLADNYNIAYGEVQSEDLPKQIFVRNMFNDINNGLDKITIDEEEISINTADYKTYLSDLYNLLVGIQLFKISDLNNLFAQLYTNSELEIPLLNKWLLDELLSKLKNSSLKGNILFVGSDYNSLYFDRVVVVDASLKNFQPKKASYLLSVDQRHDINKNLITNANYEQDFKKAEKRLVNCGKHIEYYYSLLDIDNTSSDLAYFIKDINGLPTDKDKAVEYLSNNKEIVYFVNDINVESKIDYTSPIKVNSNKQLSINPSALDNFYKCPYKYLMNNLIKPRSKTVLNSAFIGDVIHEIIHEINLVAIANDGKYDMNKAQIDNLIKESEKYQKGLKLLEPCYHDYYFEYILKAINLFLKQTEYYTHYSNYRISDTEKTVIKQLEEQNAIFKGKIDAVLKSNNDYLVVDYKSNHKLNFSVEKFDLGLSNQLISYLNLIDEPANVKGAFYQSFFKGKNEIKSSKKWAEELNKPFDDELKGILFYNDQEIDLEEDRKSLLNFDYNFDLGNEKNHLSMLSNIKLKLSSSNIKKEDLRNKKDLIQTIEVLEDDYFKVLQNHIDQMIATIREGKLEAAPYDMYSCEYCDYKKVCKNYDPNFKKVVKKKEEGDDDE